MANRDELSTRIIQEVAEREGTNPQTLSPPLYSVIDPDSLNDLFRESTGSVTFSYLGYEIVVNHSGEITIK